MTLPQMGGLVWVRSVARRKVQPVPARKPKATGNAPLP